MERFVDKIGVWGVITFVAVIVIAYALWGAAVLRAQHVGGTFTDSASAAFSIN